MTTELYSIKHYNNRLDVFNSKEQFYNSQWFMGFGKLGSEIFNSEEKIIYSITKKFKFWKWKMVYTIKDSKDNLIQLVSQNNRKTIYAIAVNEVTYKIKIHFKKKISIYKNEKKIAELDASFSDENFKECIKLQLLDKKDLEICFLLFSCIKIGETEQNSSAILSSQKQLETNEEAWS
ncbi:hypothetical protein BTO04_08535 [Polaribacter sp. SA4-10]|uniref:hypothetical protein n=1 Tax=Polaribacter sp. SA4-10 TaxID=754397 RepID=UPI000B3CF507|nr:hypothetical protein [Polaribacter sp. SA4-10]ARV06735.1 hypothetical protein BTO04_08535 [Polaribacter sp. SA4-10]